MDSNEEILCILQEECAEVTQEISKIRRFGWESFHPMDPEQKTNREHLTEEVGDLFAMVKLLVERGFIDMEHVEIAAKAKLVKLEKWSNIRSSQ